MSVNATALENKQRQPPSLLRIAASCVLVKIVCWPMLVVAQGSEAGSEVNQSSGLVIEEIIVTANKREENLREYAGSISAFSGEKLEKIGAQSLSDYLKLEPGVTMRSEGENRSVPTIRGIGIQNQVGPSQTGFTTGIFFADIPFSDLLLPIAVPDIHPFDLARIEVLKGPQGTVFGAQALAGAIRFIPNAPAFDAVELNLRVSESNVAESDDNNTVLSGMVNIPVGDDFALRAVVLDRESAGYIDDLSRGIDDVNGVKQSGGRLMARWTPTERLDISAMLFKQDFDQGDTSLADNRQRLERNNTQEDQPYQAEYDARSLNISYGFDWLSLYVSANRYTKDVAFQLNTAPQLGDLGGGPVGALAPVRNFIAGVNEGKFEEIRLSEPASYEGSWTWLVGIARLKNELDFNQQLESPGIEDNLDVINQLPPVTPVEISSANFQVVVADIMNIAEEKSIFAAVSYTFRDKLELGVAARYFRTDLESDSRIRGLQALAVTQEFDLRGKQNVDESGLNPAYTVKYTFNDNILAFAKAAKGFQFGGVQLIPATFVQQNASGGGGFQTYDSSNLWNYELGTRTTWFNRRLQFDTTAFYLDWKDLQLSIRDSSGLFSIIQNVAEARAMGVEAGIQLILWDGLTLSGSATWLDAITKSDFDSAAGPVPEGTPLPGAAEFQGAGVLSYIFPMARFADALTGWTANLSMSYSHIGEAPTDLQKNATLGGYHSVDAGIGVQKTEGRWRPELRLQITNLKDVRGVSSAASVRQDLFGGQSAEVSELIYFNQPRTVTLTLGLKY